jgi:DNA mismatch repair protein MSH5
MAESAAVVDGDQAFVALCYSNKIMGLSCYDELQNAIICDAFQVPTEELEETMINIKDSLHPTMFLLHPKIIANKPLLDIILAGPDGAPEAYRFKVLKSSVWSDKACNQRIHGSLTIKGQSGATSHCQRIASVVDLDSEQCRHTLGALIAYMQESVFKLDAGKVVVADVRQFSQGSCMQIDQGSFAALQIFAEEVHPNVMKGKGRSKEGFSLFGLFDRTHSLPGRQRLREWMSRPMCSKEKILHRQRGVALVTRQSNRDFIAEVCSQLRHFHDVPRLLLRVKKVEATFVEWCRLQSSLATSQKLLDRIGAFINSPLTDTADAEYVRELFHALDVGTVHRLAGLLQSAIDAPESEAQSCVVFREAYDAGLDRLRHTLDHLETHLVQAAHAVLEVVPLLQVNIFLSSLYRSRMYTLTVDNCNSS